MNSAEKKKLAVIIPVLNDAIALEKNLKIWASRRHDDLTVITVDGGSDDNSFDVGSSLSDICISSESGRARQMNAGANLVDSHFYLFLHADTHITEHAYQLLCEYLQNANASWGFFRVRLDNPSLVYRIIERLMNWRSETSCVATGDQCLFVSNDTFERVGRFLDIPLMEDVVITKMLRQLNPPKVIKAAVLTSARRWEKHGVAKTILTMWLLRAAFFLGVSPQRLHRLYY